MIQVTLRTEPEGEISVLNVSGDMTFDDRAELLLDLSVYLLGTLRNSIVDERATELYARNNRRVMIIVGYLSDHLQHRPTSWRVILLRSDGVEFSRIDYTLAGDKVDRVEESPLSSRPTRFEHEPVI